MDLSRSTYCRHLLENIFDAVPQCRRDSILGHFDRLRACRRVAHDAVTEHIPRTSRFLHNLLRMVEQVVDGLSVGWRQVRNRHLAAALNMGAAETGQAPDAFNF